MITKAKWNRFKQVVKLSFLSLFTIIFHLVALFEGEHVNISLLYFANGVFLPITIYYWWRFFDDRTGLFEKVTSHRGWFVYSVLLLVAAITMGVLLFWDVVVIKRHSSVLPKAELTVVLSRTPKYERHFNGPYSPTTRDITIYQSTYPDVDFIIPDSYMDRVGKNYICNRLAARDTVQLLVSERTVEVILNKSVKPNNWEKHIEGIGDIIIHGLKHNGIDYVNYYEQGPLKRGVKYYLKLALLLSALIVIPVIVLVYIIRKRISLLVR